MGLYINWKDFNARSLWLAAVLAPAVVLLCAPVAVAGAEDAASLPDPEQDPVVALADEQTGFTGSAYFDDFRQELILRVTMPPFLLSEAMIAFQDGPRYYLPVMEMSEMLYFSIDGDVGRGYVSGWFLSEENSFVIDVQRGEVTLRGEKMPLGADDYVIDEMFDDDIFISYELLNRIWPVDFAIDLSRLEIVVSSEEKLPFQLALEREGRRSRATGRGAQRRVPPHERTDLPFKSNPYKALSLPFIDLEQQLRWSERSQSVASQTSFNATHDLAGMSASYSGTLNVQDGNVQRPGSIRFQATRQAFGDETMPLGVKQVMAGDVRAPMRRLVGNAVSGRGVQLSNEPVERFVEFDQLTVRGEGLPGYEVELYRNEQLIDFGEVDETGEYLFENVPLNVGNNTVRVMLYGPQGQIEERVETFEISGGLLPPGDSRLEVAMVEADRPFIALDSETRARGDGIAQSLYAARGLSTNLTAFASYMRRPLPREDEDRHYASAGAMVSALGGFGQVEAYKEKDGGMALDARFATNLAGLRLNAQTAYFHDFESQEAGFGGSAKKFEADLRASTNIGTGLGMLGLRLDTNYTRRVDGTSFTRVGTQQSLGSGGIRFNNQTRTQFTDQQHNSTSGTISATGRRGLWQLRSAMTYNLYPELEFVTGQAELRYRSRDSFTAALSLHHNFLDSSSGAGAQFGYDFGRVLGSVNANWDQNNGFDITMRASASLVPAAKNNAYILSSQRLGNAAMVRGHVFADYDGDGIYGAEDEGLEEARLLLGGRPSRERSGPDGIVSGRLSGAGGLTTVELDKASLQDPYHQPAVAGYRAVARPGSIMNFDFPVMETGAIDGTISYEDGRPVQGIDLQLIDESRAPDEQIVMSVTSAYDGFYTFEFVPPGTYRVQVDPVYGVNVPPETVTLSPEDIFVFGIDLYLIEEQEEEEEEEEF